MFVNLFVLFICINLALGLVTGVDGSPLKVDMAGDCEPYPIATAPEIDPIIGAGISGMSDMEDFSDEMVRPTNSTDTDPDWLGDNNPFNALTETATRGWKAMETMLNVASGGYIFDIIENTAFDCALDSRALLGTSVDSTTNVIECMAVKQADGSDYSPPLEPPCTNPFYGGMNKAKTVTVVQQDCIDWYNDDPPPVGDGHPWLETAPPVQVSAPCFVDVDNEMWVQFKYGVYIVFSMMMIITVFYWLTGRGHILSG
jgi:hypothetical protein